MSANEHNRMAGESAVGREVRQAGKHSFVYMLGQALSRAVGFFMIPIYTRLISPADYGVLDLVTICGGILALTISFTSSEALSRLFYAEQEQSRRNLVVSTAVIGSAICGLALVAIAISFSGQIGLLVFGTHDHDSLLVLSFVSSWCALLLDNGTAYLRLRYFSKLFIIVVVSQLVIALTLNIYFVVSEGIGIRGILYSSAISSLCVALPIAVWILRVSKARFSAKVFVAIVRFGVPLLPSQLGLSLGYISNRFFLQRYASLTEVGLFSFGYSVGVVVSRFVSTPLNNFWAPRKLELLLSHTEEARTVVARMCTYSTMLIIFVTLLLSLTARDIVMIIAGSQYFRAHEIIPVIGLAIAIGSLENHVNAGILLEKRTALLALCGSISLAVVLAANYMLVPLLGMLGAAIATLVGTALRVFLILGTSQRIHPLPFEIVQLLKGFSVAFFIYGFGTLFVLHENPGVEFGLRVLTGCTFPLGLIALKCVGGAEIAIVRNVLRGPTMVAVASQEKVP